MIQKLPAEHLRWKFDNFELAQKILEQKAPKSAQRRLGAMAQERAHSALELGLGIRQRGYNIFVVGASGTGRTSTVNQMLNERAQKEATPDDIVLLFNFENRDRPLAISIPASLGPKLKKTYETLVEKILKNLEAAFFEDSYVARKQTIQEACRKKTEEALATMEKEANAQSFVLSRAGGAITITPANEDGDAITEDEFNNLSDSKKEELEQKAEKLEARLEDALRKVRSAEKEGEDAIEMLEKETASRIVSPFFENAKAGWKNIKVVLNHIDAMREDMLAKIRRLVPDYSTPPQEGADQNAQMSKGRKAYEEEEEFEYDEHILLRYRVNILVTRTKGSGAPVVHETHPTSSNLIGRIEQRIRAGETVTDFTRIRAGALYKANGGYLVIDANDLLRDASAWEGLKRALKNRAVELDDPGEPGRMIALASLRPEPVTLSLKVILIGTPDLYYLLSKNDPDFSKLFKVKADFDIEMERSEDRIEKYLKFLSGLCVEEQMHRLSPQGAGRIMEHAVRLAGNQKKLTSRLGDIADLLREADYWADKEKAKLIEPAHVKQALAARAEREGFLEAHIFDDIRDGKITIETQGEVVGQSNALTVIELGTYEFGVPVRITCKIASGKGELIDIERETELGGPIHTKGTLIIKGLIADQFGQDISLGFTATLCMEQTYSDVDGDSASLAETCALLSTLAGAPINQRFAITGSIDQRGRVQSVGGVNEKIEGFYKVCKLHKSTIVPGVIIPASNVSDMMLNEEVVESCRKGEFMIYAVESFEDTIELLTGRAWNQGKNALRPTILKTLEHLRNIRDSEYDARKSIKFTSSTLSQHAAQE